MSWIQRLKWLYALVGLTCAGYWSENLIAAHIRNRVPISSGTVYCLLLFVSVPAFGYILLFQFLPFAGRFLRRQ